MKLLENIKNFGYITPKDPELLLYDFYFIVGYLLGDRKEDPLLDFVFKEATKDCVENLRKHMLKALKWSLSAEFRNIFDATYLDVGKMEDDLKVFLKEYRKIFSSYSDEALQLFTPDRMNTKYQQNSDVFSDQSLFDDDEHSYSELGSRNTVYADSFFALQKMQKNNGYSDEDIAKWFIRCFDPDSLSIRWKTSYGGGAWQNIAKAYLNLMNATTMAKKIAYIDHAYDLQHNSGSVFTKVSAYTSSSRDSNWLAKALDWKKDQTDLRGFYDKVSGSLRPVVAWIAKNEQKKGTIEDFERKPSSEKSPPKKIFGTLSVGDYVTIRRDLGANQEYGGITFVSMMKRFLGKKLRIGSIDGDVYHMNGWSWTKEMFDSVEHKKPEASSKVTAAGKIKVGDKVTVINNQYTYTSYAKWARKYGLSNFIPSDVHSNDHHVPKNGQQVKVVVIGPFSDAEPDHILLGVESLDSDRTQYIISAAGGVKKAVQ